MLLKQQNLEKKADEEMPDDLMDAISTWMKEHAHEYVPSRGYNKSTRNEYTPYLSQPPDTFNDYVDDLVDAVGGEFDMDLRDTEWVNLEAEELLSSATKNRKEEDEYGEAEYGRSRRGSANLNKVIEDMQEFEDEFLPAWKRWKAALASFGLTAQDFSNYEQGQRSVLSIIDAYANEIPEDAYIDQVDLQNQFLKIDPDAKLPINQRISTAVAKIYDTTALKAIFTALWSGVQSGFAKVPPANPGTEPPPTAPPAAPMPSGTREFEIAPGPSGLETASKKPARAQRVAATVARIGYSDKAKLTVKFDTGAKFAAYVAETALQRAAGLEVFDDLDPAEGLFFPFEEAGSVTFHMGSVAFPIDIVFLMDSPHGLQVGKVVANIEPGSQDWWSYPGTSAVLEVAGGMCKKANIKEGAICTIGMRIEAEESSSEYNISLPDYAGDSSIFELFDLISKHDSGHRTDLSEGNANVSLGELHAIERLLVDIDMGRYMPGYPAGQLSVSDSIMNRQEEAEYEAEQDYARNDMIIAEAWLPEIRELISENELDEDAEPEPEDDDVFMQPSGSLGSRTSVNAGGKFLGEFSSDEEAEAAIKDWMEENHFYPNVWKISDHGNVDGPIVLE